MVAGSAAGPPRVTVAVVSICGAAHLTRCLDALAAQTGAPPFEVVVVFDPHLEDVPALQPRYPDVRLVSNEGQRTPLELASRAVREAGGDIVLLTEDHCVPRPDWVATLLAAVRPGRGAVGGVVEPESEARAVDWAFFYVDFFRYMRPVREGPSPSLTVCNVAYRRSDLEAIRPLWESFFHETAINDALRKRFGPLWLVPEAEVRMRRTVRFADAVYERYAFGRLFGCTRLVFAGPARRLFYTVFAPTLPLLLLGRMAAKAVRRPPVWLRFLKAAPALAVMVLAWSWGEWLGYLTRRRPRTLVVAPEIVAARRARRSLPTPSRSEP
jgi:hypothetical protein